MNCQTRGLTSIQKGLGKDVTPFLVISNSIKESENVPGRVSGENLETLREAIFTNPEGSQSRDVLFFPIRRGPNFPNPEGSDCANPERSYFCQSGGVPILPIRKGLVFANPEGSYFCQSGGVPILPIRKGLVFANPEGSYFCQSGGVLFRQNFRRQQKRK